MYFLFWLFILAAVAVNWAPFKPFYDELEGLNRNRIAVAADAYSGPLIGAPRSNEPVIETAGTTPLVIRTHSDEPPPSPCFFYHQPGLTGRIICTR